MIAAGALYPVGLLIDLVLLIFLGFLLARIVLSWLPLFVQGWTPRGAMLVIAEAIYTVTDPPLRLFGKFLPPVRIGQVSLNLAIIGVWFTTILLRWVNQQLFMS